MILVYSICMGFVNANRSFKYIWKVHEYFIQIYEFLSHPFLSNGTFMYSLLVLIFFFFAMLLNVDKPPSLSETICLFF